MPPETVSGETYVADGRIDSWSLGILIYYCLYGRHPFSGESREEVVRSICEDKVKFPKRIIQMNKKEEGALKKVKV